MVDEFTNCEHFAGGFVSEHDVASAWTVHLVELAVADSAGEFLDQDLVADRSRQFNRLYAKRAWFLWQYGDAGFCRHVASLRVRPCLKQTEARSMTQPAARPQRNEGGSGTRNVSRVDERWTTVYALRWRPGLLRCSVLKQHSTDCTTQTCTLRQPSRRWI